MPLNIKNQLAHNLAKELAELMGENITNAVTQALKEAIDRRKTVKETEVNSIIERLNEIADATASMPVQDSRSTDEILGYDDRGLPGSW